MFEDRGQSWRQFVIAGIAGLGVMNIGYISGWTSAVEIKLLEAAQSPLPEPVTPTEASWIGSLVVVGAIVGPVFGGIMASYIGRKWSLYSAAMPVLASWLLIAAASRVYMIYIGRFLAGLATGVLFTVTPMYCGEIASDDARGALGSFLNMFTVIGMQLGYCIVPFVSYSTAAIIGASIASVFPLCLYSMPESPVYHLMKGDREKAHESLAMIRGKSHDGATKELDTIAAEVSKKVNANISELWATRGNIKALCILFALLAAQPLAGIHVILMFMERIFRASNIDLPAATAAIIVGAVQLSACLIVPFVVDRLGRRILLVTSTVCMALGLFFLGLFFILEMNDAAIIPSIGFLPVLSLAVYIFAYNLGLGPIPWALVGELLPMSIKAISSPLLTTFLWTMSFIVIRFFNDLVEAVGMHWSFWIFGISCLVTTSVTLFFVPETKNKSSQEIQDILNQRKPIDTKLPH